MPVMVNEGGINIATQSKNSRWSYDVFLSFRGEDTRYTFTGNLYNALCKKRIKTFMDNDGSKSGDHISTIPKALEESKIAIVIFSKGFASSAYCLDEVVKILECQTKHGLQVLPIFYGVNPSDVCCENGSSRYQMALAKLQQQRLDNNEKTQRWMSSLSRLAPATGSYEEWQLNKRHKNKYEYERIKKIVDWVTKTLLGCDVFRQVQDTRSSYDGFLHTLEHCWRSAFSVVKRVSHVCLSEEGERSITYQEYQLQTKRWRYDVFLSYEANDTRESYTGYLYHALHRKGFKAFVNEKAFLEKGDDDDDDKVMATLGKAIEESRILIVVLSKTYALTSNCLQELTMILDSQKRNKQLVIPISYGVDPSDVEKWSSPLKEVANLIKDEHHLQIGNMDKQHIERIVDEVTNALPCNDIFLSFSGKDKCSFTEFLQTALSMKEFKTFTKDKGPSDGDHQGSDLVTTAIEKSRISIIILSQNYAYSSSCLDELVTILHCMKMKRQLVWPIFYKVKSSDLRDQTSIFQVAMIEHETKFEHDKVKKWKSAMSEAANLNGWHLKNGDEYQIIEEIVKKAIKEI